MKTIAELVAEARQERDEKIAMAEDADVTGWDKAVIDQAIEAFATAGEPFSANDLRPLLPEVRSALMGARFLAAVNRGQIRRVGFVTSTKRNTHAKPVGSYIGVRPPEATHVTAPRPRPVEVVEEYGNDPQLDLFDHLAGASS